jgi:hypothetical protein
LCIISQNLNAQKVNVSSGSVQRIETLNHNIDHRNIDVWLPEGYSDKHKYAVCTCTTDNLYMMPNHMEQTSLGSR